jgi:hypothetical protein
MFIDFVRQTTLDGLLGASRASYIGMSIVEFYQCAGGPETKRSYMTVSRGMLISQDCTEHLAAYALDFTLSIMPIQNISFLNLSIHSKIEYKRLLSIHHHMIPLDKSKATAIP